MIFNMIKKWIIKFLKRLIKIVEEQEDDFSEVDFKEWEKSMYKINEKDRKKYV